MPVARLCRRPVVRSYRRAITLRESLVADFPLVPSYRRALAGTHIHLGMLLKDIGQLPDAEKCCREAEGLFTKLVDEFPAVPKYRQDLATSHNQVGILLKDTGRHQEALRAHGKALALREGSSAPKTRKPLCWSFAGF